MTVNIAHRNIEPARLAELYRLDLLDKEPNERFEHVARIAARALGTPMALVTLIDADQQQFCASIGDLEPGSRDDSFCTHTIIRPGEVLIIPDTVDDSRVDSIPFVTGHPYIRFYAGVSTNTPAGQPIGSLCVLDTEPRDFTDDDETILRDLGAVVEREIVYTTLSITDSLTSLTNHRGFVAATQRFIRLGRRRSEPVSVIFADVNKLKPVNDQHGHLEGNRLLQRAADAIASAARTSDVAARIGGDEFAVLLYDTDIDGARTVINKIIDAVDRDNEGEPSDLRLSLALGAASADPDDSIDDLLARADSAMFDDKRDASRD